MSTKQETPAESTGVSRPAGVAPVGVTDQTVAEGVKERLPAGAFMTADHRYYFNGEGPNPSVTTVLEVMSKPALVIWKAKETARALHRGIFTKQIHELSEDEAIRWALKESDKARDTAASVGSSVHLLADMVSRSPETATEGFGVSDVARPYLEAWRGFTAFLEAQGGTIISSEKAVWSLNGYGGTYDLILSLNGELWMVDIKTSKGLYPEYGLQLAGYRWADSIILPGDPRAYPMPEIQRTAVLHLRPEQYVGGWALIEYPTTYTQDYLTFLGCLEVYKWRKEGRFEKKQLISHNPL